MSGSGWVTLAGVVAAVATVAGVWVGILQLRKTKDAAATAPASGSGRVLPWHRRAAARYVAVSWRRPDDPGAVVDNESRVKIHDGVVTVTCNERGVDAQREFDSVAAGKSFEWPSDQVHQAIDARAGGRESGVGRATGDNAQPHRDGGQPHRVEATFGVGRGFWHSDNAGGPVKRVSSLVIWVERTQANTLGQYFDQRSAFHKGYRIKVEVKPFANIEALEQAFTRLVSHDELPQGDLVPPDIVVGPHDWIGRVAVKESVTDPLPIARERYRFDPNAIGALRHQGRLYAIPYVFDSVALIRNDTLTGPGDMPATIDELLAPWQDAVRDGRLVLALRIGKLAGDPYYMWPLFASAGGTFFGMQTQVTDSGVQPVEAPGGKDSWREGFIGAFAQIAGLGFGPGGSKVLRPDMSRDPGPDPGQEPGALAEFLAGRAPYLIHSSRVLQSIKKAGMRVTVGPVPRLGPQPAQPLVSVYGFFIYHRAPNLPAARDLLSSYLSNTEAGLDLNKIQPLVPVQKDAMTHLEGQDPLLAAYIKQCQGGMIMPTYPKMRKAWQLLGQTEYKVLAGDGEPREIAAKAFDEGRKNLDEARSA